MPGSLFSEGHKEYIKPGQKVAPGTVLYHGPHGGVYYIPGENKKLQEEEEGQTEGDHNLASYLKEQIPELNGPITNEEASKNFSDMATAKFPPPGSDHIVELKPGEKVPEGTMLWKESQGKIFCALENGHPLDKDGGQILPPPPGKDHYGVAPGDNPKKAPADEKGQAVKDWSAGKLKGEPLRNILTKIWGKDIIDNKKPWGDQSSILQGIRDFLVRKPICASDVVEVGDIQRMMIDRPWDNMIQGREIEKLAAYTLYRKALGNEDGPVDLNWNLGFLEGQSWHGVDLSVITPGDFRLEITNDILERARDIVRGKGLNWDDVSAETKVDAMRTGLQDIKDKYEGSDPMRGLDQNDVAARALKLMDKDLGGYDEQAKDVSTDTMTKSYYWMRAIEELTAEQLAAQMEGTIQAAPEYAWTQGPKMNEAHGNRLVRNQTDWQEYRDNLKNEININKSNEITPSQFPSANDASERLEFAINSYAETGFNFMKGLLRGRVAKPDEVGIAHKHRYFEKMKDSAASMFKVFNQTSAMDQFMQKNRVHIDKPVFHGLASLTSMDLPPGMNPEVGGILRDDSYTSWSVNPFTSYQFTAKGSYAHNEVEPTTDWNPEGLPIMLQMDKLNPLPGYYNGGGEWEAILAHGMKFKIVSIDDVKVSPWADLNYGGGSSSRSQAQNKWKVIRVEPVEVDKIQFDDPDKNPHLEALGEKFKEIFPNDELRDKVGRGVFELAPKKGEWDRAVQDITPLYEKRVKQYLRGRETLHKISPDKPLTQEEREDVAKALGASFYDAVKKQVARTEVGEDFDKYYLDDTPEKDTLLQEIITPSWDENPDHKKIDLPGLKAWYRRNKAEVLDTFFYNYGGIPDIQRLKDIHSDPLEDTRIVNDFAESIGKYYEERPENLVKNILPGEKNKVSDDGSKYPGIIKLQDARDILHMQGEAQVYQDPETLVDGYDAVAMLEDIYGTTWDKLPPEATKDRTPQEIAHWWRVFDKKRGEKKPE